QDLIDCGLDPAPVVSLVGQLGANRAQAQRRAALSAREELSGALVGRLGDYALGIDGVSVTLTLTVGSALHLADLVRGAACGGSGLAPDTDPASPAPCLSCKGQGVAP